MAKNQNTEEQDSTSENGAATGAPAPVEALDNGIPIGAIIDASEAKGGQYENLGAGKLKRVG